MQNQTRPTTAQVSLEADLLYGLACLKAGIFNNPNSNLYPHMYTENSGLFPYPVMAQREVWTPNDGMRLITTVAFKIDARYSREAGGYWNYAIPLALNEGAD